MPLDDRFGDFSDGNFSRSYPLNVDSMTTISNNSNVNDVGSSASDENDDNGSRSTIKLASVAKAVTVTFIADRQGIIRFQKNGKNGKLVSKISKYTISNHNHIHLCILKDILYYNK